MHPIPKFDIAYQKPEYKVGHSERWIVILNDIWLWFI